MEEDTFDFITPAAFRRNIIESVEFTAWLWVTAQGIESKYVDDINRTIILYNCSIIEALLLFRAKKKKIKFFDVVQMDETISHLSKKRSGRLTLEKSQESFDSLLAIVTKIKNDMS